MPINIEQNLILFDPICRLGETLYHKHDKDKENPLIAVNFNINATNIKNEVVDYTVGCCDMDGRLIYFKPFELKKEEVEA